MFTIREEFSTWPFTYQKHFLKIPHAHPINSGLRLTFTSCCVIIYLSLKPSLHSLMSLPKYGLITGGSKAITLYYFFLMFIYFERERSHGRGTREREREGESQAGSMLSMQSQTRGLNPTNHEESDTQQTEPPRRPEAVIVSYNRRDVSSTVVPSSIRLKHYLPNQSEGLLSFGYVILR